MLYYFKQIILISTIYFFLKGCGTIYTPQTLPEARGISLAEGQEKLEVEVIPLTFKAINNANEDDYERRVIDAGDLSRAASLISVNAAINEKLPTEQDPGPYKLGVGDVLRISQLITTTNEINGGENLTKEIVPRDLAIADGGYASMLSIGRIELANKTIFQAEDTLKLKLAEQQLNPQFELFISEFNSKKIYITNNFITLEDQNPGIGGSNNFQIQYTNFPIFLNEVLDDAKLILPNGKDAKIVLKRSGNEYRISARKVIERKYKKIRLFPEDQIIIKPIPYRPERVIIVGEIKTPRLYDLSPSERRTLSDALYEKSGLDKLSSDMSQIYLLRPSKNSNKIKAYHLDASNPSRLLLAAKFELRPNDIIFVATQPVANYNRAFSQIFGAYAMTVDPSSQSEN